MFSRASNITAVPILRLTVPSELFTFWVLFLGGLVPHISASLPSYTERLLGTIFVHLWEESLASEINIFAVGGSVSLERMGSRVVGRSVLVMTAFVSGSPVIAIILIWPIFSRQLLLPFFPWHHPSGSLYSRVLFSSLPLPFLLPLKLFIFLPSLIRFSLLS